MAVNGVTTWLTPDEKRRRLRALAKEIQSGAVDAPIIPYLVKLNTVRGLVTMHSCTGHRERDTRGNLSFRVSERRFQWFLHLLVEYQKVFEADDLGMSVELGAEGYAWYSIRFSNFNWHRRLEWLIRAARARPRPRKGRIKWLPFDLGPTEKDFLEANRQNARELGEPL